MASSQAIFPAMQTAGWKKIRETSDDGRLPDEDCLSKGEEDVFMS